MKRILSTSLVLSVLLLPACKGGTSAEPIKLVPDDADFIVGISPKAISESPVYAKFAAQFENEPDFKDNLATFKDCGLDPLKFDSIVIGASEEREFVVVISGDSVGKEDAAVCAFKSMQKQAGKEETAEVSKEDGRKVIKGTDGTVYLLNDNMLALVSNGWKEPVTALFDGKGTPAVDNSGKDLLAKVDTGRAMWMVANVPPGLADMGGSQVPAEVKEIKSLAGSLDFSSGVAVDLVATFSAEDKAAAANAQLQGLLVLGKNKLGEEYRPMLENNVKAEAAGADLKLSVTASMEDIDKLAGLIPQR